jgi:hypothetical protein
MLQSAAVLHATRQTGMAAAEPPEPELLPPLPELELELEPP